jgi:2,4-didehydro-3-deoxy-L-rhamnonate hydrolase
MIQQGYRLGSFATAGCLPFAGILLPDDRVIALHAADRIGQGLTKLHCSGSLESLFENWDHNRAALDAIVARILQQPECLPLVPLAQLDVCVPLQPRNLICAGMNYRKHVLDFFDDEAEKASWAKSLDEKARNGLSFMFAKPTGAITAADCDIVIPSYVKQMDWEVELVAVIGRKAWRVDRSEALDYVAGYTIGNDVSARDLMPRDDIQPGMYDFFSGKSGPNFNPIGPFILPSQFAPDPQEFHLTLRLNGDVMQDEGATDMIDPVAKLIEFASSRTILYPGDMISTGSPSGNAKLHNRYLRPGDVIEGEIGMIGRQVLRFHADSTAPVEALADAAQ